MRLKTICIGIGLLFVVLLLSASVVAQKPDFNAMTGSFKQAKSDIEAIYSHTLAFAETDPAAFKAAITPRAGGWAVMLGGRQTFVAKPEMNKSIANGFSFGKPDNLINIFSLAVSKRSGGYDPVTAKLSYGKADFRQYVGTGNWVIYDNQQENGKALADGITRLIKDFNQNGHPKRPCVVTLVEPNEETLTKYAQLFDGGTRSLSVSSYDAKEKTLYLRGPHNPQLAVSLPSDALSTLAAGIDFMDPEVIKIIQVPQPSE
ncbi:MAG: hypothetical protein ABFD64_11900 [Armatimonadota bacterium]